MNKKLIFRILGAVSSALIIVSLFIPYISVSGYSQSLWHAYSTTDALYLPIIIIVFGVIGVLFFSLNIKTEIAYSTAGALLFYIITETISFIDQGMISTLSVGYYCLVIGTLLTAIMAFLSNLKQKQKVVNVVEKPENPVEIITQMDALYGNSNKNIQSQPVMPIPDMATPVQPAMPIPDTATPVQPAMPIPDMAAPVQSAMPIPDMATPVQPAMPIPDMATPVQPAMPVPDMAKPAQQMESVPNMGVNQINTLNNEDKSLNPVVAEFSSPLEQGDVLSQTSNPVINEFNSASNTVLPNIPKKVEPKVETPSNNLDIFN